MEYDSSNTCCLTTNNATQPEKKGLNQVSEILFTSSRFSVETIGVSLSQRSSSVASI